MKKKIFGVEISKELVFVIIILVIIAALASYKNLLTHNWTPPETLTGQWAGQAEITELVRNGESTSPKTSCNIDILINPDGTVTGKIGNADLLNGKIRKNRTWFDKLFRLKSDYVINGNIKNGIVDADKVTERVIRFPFDLVDGQYEGRIYQPGAWATSVYLFSSVILNQQE